MLTPVEISPLPHPPSAPPPDAPDLLRAHYLSLGAGSRRLRFMGGIKDGAINAIADRAAPAELITLKIDGVLRGVLEVFETSKGHVEIGLSIEDEWQGLGHGRALFDQGIALATKRGYDTADLHFFRGNEGVRRLVLKHGGKLRCRGGDCEAEIDLNPHRNPPAPLDDSGLRVSAKKAVTKGLHDVHGLGNASLAL
jgi:GNAT superfamily N-acetyltransferase